MCRLSNEEKRELSKLARRAWQYMTRNGATDEDEGPFRQRISIQACGRRISEALRDHYHSIEAAFLLILGETKQALQAADKSQTAGRRIALHKLTELLASQQRTLEYAAPLLRNFYRTTLELATTKQLWAVYYELGGGKGRGRGTKRRQAFKARQRDAGAEVSGSNNIH
ncbi:hypothetical protein AYO49_05465 [Verrucomicrobiaceae bacterium SCGC AG-212-N21]|nr:hypothetical protein AYO49_05465 [Verrucomicrobiaceae bacterium SCGC AG-212-N21]